MTRTKSWTRTRSTLRRSLAAGLATAGLIFAALPGATPATQPVHADNYIPITVSGSTQMQTLGQLLANRYSDLHPNIHFTVNASSSQAGFDQTCTTGAQLGMSDSYIQDSQLREPGCNHILGIPVAVSATTVVYNLPGTYFNQRKADGFTLVHPLRLSPRVLSAIYSGSIQNWSDRAIKRLNPGMRLPNQPIQAFNSAEPGGAGFVFDQWLALSDPSWSQTVGIALQPLWPRGYSIGQPSTGAMVTAIGNTSYSIGFAGFDYAISYHLQAASLLNASRSFLTPSLNGVALAIGQALQKGFAGDFRTPFVTVAGSNAFNPACLEFFEVHQDLKAISTAPAANNQAVKAFLTWAVSDSGGQRYIESIEFRKTGSGSRSELAHGFIPVPQALRDAIRRAVASIQA